MRSAPPGTRRRRSTAPRPLLRPGTRRMPRAGFAGATPTGTSSWSGPRGPRLSGPDPTVVRTVRCQGVRCRAVPFRTRCAVARARPVILAHVSPRPVSGPSPCTTPTPTARRRTVSPVPGRPRRRCSIRGQLPHTVRPLRRGHRRTVPPYPGRALIAVCLGRRQLRRRTARSGSRPRSMETPAPPRAPPAPPRAPPAPPTARTYPRPPPRSPRRRRGCTVLIPALMRAISTATHKIPRPRARGSLARRPMARSLKVLSPKVRSPKALSPKAPGSTTTPGPPLPSSRTGQRSKARAGGVGGPSGCWSSGPYSSRWCPEAWEAP